MSDTLELLRAQLKTNACTTFAGAACCTPPGNCDCYVAAQAITEIERLRANAPYAGQLAYFLRIYDHAHQNGNSVPPNIVAQARAAMGALAAPSVDTSIVDTYTAPVPAGYTHALDCAYKASPRHHCTCGYVDPSNDQRGEAAASSAPGRVGSDEPPMIRSQPSPTQFVNAIGNLRTCCERAWVENTRRPNDGEEVIIEHEDGERKLATWTGYSWHVNDQRPNATRIARWARKPEGHATFTNQEPR